MLTSFYQARCWGMDWGHLQLRGRWDAPPRLAWGNRQASYGVASHRGPFRVERTPVVDTLQRAWLHDQPEHRQYTEGWCGEFAMALHREYNYRIMIIATKCPPDGVARRHSRVQDIHAVTQDLEGNYLDVNGVQSTRELKQTWGRWCLEQERLIIYKARMPWAQPSWYLDERIIYEARQYIRHERPDLRPA